MRAALALAWRETRGGWRHLTGLVACIALGVAALTAVGTFAAGIERALSREARSLMGGDVEVRAARPLDASTRAALGRLAAEGATPAAVRELAAMARAGERTQLVELKAVEAGYPLYGRVETEPGHPLGALLARRGAVVGESLLARLAVRVGDPVTIGATVFTVRGVLRREPDGPGGFLSLGPRVLIAAEALESTGLVTFGSRVRYRTLVRLPARVSATAVRERLIREIDDPGVRITAFDEAQPGLRRFFTQLAGYLGLVGLVSLLVGGIGVASAISTFIRRRVATLAILKVLGADTRTLLATYLVQTLALALAGSVAGIALGAAAQPLLARLLAGTVPFTLDGGWEPWTAARALVMGLATALLCAIWPLLTIRAIRPSLILRRDVDAAARQAPRPWAAALPIVLGLAALALWQAGSLKTGAIFIGASAAAVAGLVALARALVWLSPRAGRGQGLAWRQGLANLRRPGGQTTAVVVALGVGVMLLVSVALLEGSLGHHMDHERRREAPSFFFVDLQADQREAFSRMVAAASEGRSPALTPVVRSRLAAVNGARVTREMVEARRRQGDDRTWYLTRDYVLTFAAEPPASGALVSGRWWTVADLGRPHVSVEEGAARYLGVRPGDTLAFDVQGLTVEADVMSIRRVDWQSLTTNFFVIFSPGALDGAPTTWVATARVVPAAETRLQDSVVRAFPNVTVIPVRDVLERAAGVVDRIALAIRLIALFAIAAGLAVMAGALAASRYARLYESVVWRALGATRGAVARIFAVEYAALGAAAGLGGTVLAAVLAWVVLHFVLDVPWTFEPAALLLGIALTVVLALLVGFLGTYRLLGEKPLRVLRQE